MMEKGKDFYGWLSVYFFFASGLIALITKHIEVGLGLILFSGVLFFLSQCGKRGCFDDFI